MPKQRVIVFLPVLVFILLSCDQIPDSYYPLNEGREWEYQVSGRSMFGAGAAATIVMTNLGPRELYGQTVTPQKVEANAQTYFTFVAVDSSGVCEFAKQAPENVEPEQKIPPVYLIKYPIAVGTSWRSQAETSLLTSKVPITLVSTIESIAEVVTVPAGTFNQCIKIKSVGNTRKNLGVFGSAKVTVESYSWYALGVGVIKSALKETSNNLMVGGGEATIQLKSFKK